MSTGSSLSDQVDQKPADIYSKPGENAKITCSHSIPDYYRILWYKQSDGQLQFLGYTHYSDGNPESGVNVKMEGGANKNETCTLTIPDLTLNSSAVYFCAASLHSATYHCSSAQKPPITCFHVCIKAHSLLCVYSILSLDGSISLLRPLYLTFYKKVRVHMMVTIMEGRGGLTMTSASLIMQDCLWEVSQPNMV